MQFPKTLTSLALVSSLLSPAVQAHFQEIIPSADIVESAKDASLTIDLTFTHPMEQGPVMNMAMPETLDVITPSGRESLLTSLSLSSAAGEAQTYQVNYQLKKPGDHIFYIQPAPYWEPAEGVMIVHHTKVVVDAFNGEANWDALVGAPVEIEPLTRPYGLWTGNLFQGIVKKHGKPVPFAEVEVEWRNDGTVTAPYESYITQVIKADANGVFSYVMPKSGWWGFAALVEADQPMTNPEGKSVPVEEGGLIWVRTRDMK
jgi:cobalt/nickel transport protein